MTDAQKQQIEIERNHRDNTPRDQDERDWPAAKFGGEPTANDLEVSADLATVTLRGAAALAYARELVGSLCYGPHSAADDQPEITVRTDHPDHESIMSKIFPPTRPARRQAAFTPGAWETDGTNDILSPSGRVIAKAWGDDDTELPNEDASANSERIVACVNACSGLTTAELSIGTVQLVSHQFLSEAGERNARQKDTILQLRSELERIANGSFARADQPQAEQHLRAVAAEALRTGRLPGLQD